MHRDLARQTPSGNRFWLGDGTRQCPRCAPPSCRHSCRGPVAMVSGATSAGGVALAVLAAPVVVAVAPALLPRLSSPAPIALISHASCSTCSVAARTTESRSFCSRFTSPRNRSWSRNRRSTGRRHAAHGPGPAGRRAEPSESRPETSHRTRDRLDLSWRLARVFADSVRHSLLSCQAKR